jgi:hypothetical protein
MFGVGGDTAAGAPAGDAESLMEEKRAKAEEARRQLDALFGDDEGKDPT